MPLLSLVESARRIGWSIELLKYLTKHCPKHGQDRKIPFKLVEGEISIEEADLLAYQRYLSEPWPIPEGQARPPMRDAIADDIRAESHHECAVCGQGNHNEIAHIQAAANGASNSPDNLILLCPNHHTRYDYGFKRADNVNAGTIAAAKTIKRESRRRILLHEANAANALKGLIQLVSKAEARLKELDDPQLREVNVTELKSLMGLIGKASTEASKLSVKDREYTATESAVIKLAPSLAVLAGATSKKDNEKALRKKATDVLSASSKVILDLDEVDCPRCGGLGQVGWGGSLCGYCGGSCYVSKKKAKEFDSDSLDEVECPHCYGCGQRGFRGDLCVYCKGDAFVTHQQAEDYDRKEIDEKDCPRCDGNGYIGRNMLFCNYCKGSCFVSQKKYDAFEQGDLDEVECPHCHGAMQTGLRGDLCIYCKGDGIVPQHKADDYRPDELNEIDCPHCHGAGTIGFNNEFCSYCKGSCVVTREKREAYDPEELEEEQCPRCGGSGQTGLVGDRCALCKGSCVVSRAVAEAYRRES